MMAQEVKQKMSNPKAHITERVLKLKKEFVLLRFFFILLSLLKLYIEKQVKRQTHEVKIALDDFALFISQGLDWIEP